MRLPGSSAAVGLDGAQLHTRLRSPYAPSMRRTAGHTLVRPPADGRPVGYTATSREYGWSHSPTRHSGVCGAPRSGLSSTGHSPRPTRSISSRMAIMASQKASISSRFSLSVGSTIRVPATGKLIVGAWKP